MMDKIVRLPAILLTIFLSLGPVPLARAATGDPGAAEGAVAPELREEAVGVLRDAVRTQERWVKVHAAEALLALDYDLEEVAAAFDAERARDGDTPQYRIGIRRVLARGSASEALRQQLIGEIRDAFLATDGPDRVHAAETLGKLGYTMRPEGDTEFERVAFADDSPLATYAAWVLANTDPERGQSRLTELLTSDDGSVRGTAAYVLRHQPLLADGVWDMIAAAAKREPAESGNRIHLIIAAYRHAAPSDRQALKSDVLTYASNGLASERYQACFALADLGDTSDLPLLTELLRHSDADVRIGAAVACLRIDRRLPRHLAGADWVVLLLYGVGMLLVGWYYSRRTTTQEDYLLGGRSMKPWAVGLSLFATLLSTISYLAVPGEIIKHGPMIIANLAILPVIVVVVGWLLIPFFMRLKVISAYEILESRLGVSVRILGSVFFLSLRLLWMAVIIYATTSKVLIPLLGWNESATPLVCAILGIITVVYTSMGGLRAVVFTDVVQTFILFGGAFLTVALITVKLDGIGAWWPTEWAANWDPPKFWFDANVRLTFASACLATFTWHICTAGSDQMAIQRYLATRDAKSARRMYITSMAANAIVTLFLAILGCALLAFFRFSPHLVPDGHTIASGADKLFTRYIVSGLPPGISGLIIAGLLAAAMSSLSSGVNSSCSVVTVDFVERFRRDKSQETNHIRLARIVSWVVGAVVVALSANVGLVKGNLLEVTYKLVNLLVTPLFVLFFMAMFVPWATTFGTLAAAAASTAVAVGIAFFSLLNLSVFWIMPCSLVVGVVVGLVASLVPIPEKQAGEPGQRETPGGQ